MRQCAAYNTANAATFRPLQCFIKHPSLKLLVACKLSVSAFVFGEQPFTAGRWRKQGHSAGLLQASGQAFDHRVEAGLEEEGNGVALLPRGVEHAVRCGAVKPVGPAFELVADVDNQSVGLRRDCQPLAILEPDL